MSLNNVPHQSSVVHCSKEDDTCMDMLACCFMNGIQGMDHIWQVWIIPQTNAWPPTTPGRTQLLPWSSKKRTWTMYRISCVVAQGRWSRYGYDITLFHEGYIMHISRLTGVNCPHIPLYHLQLHPCATLVTHCLEVLLLVFVDSLWCGLWHRFGLLDAWYWRPLWIFLEEGSNGVKWPLGFT